MKKAFLILFLALGLLRAELIIGNGIKIGSGTKELKLAPGQSEVFDTLANIQTVFVSNPKVLDYKIVNGSTIAIYAVSDGYSEIRAFGNDDGINTTLLSVKAYVDGDLLNLQKIAKSINQQNPGADIKIEKLGVETLKPRTSQRGFVISGSVPSDEIRERVYLMTAAALGLNVRRDNVRRQVVANTSSKAGADLSQTSNKSNDPLQFLERIRVEGLIDAMVVDAIRQVNVKLVVADVEKSLADRLGLDFNNGNIIQFPLAFAKTNGVPSSFGIWKDKFSFNLQATLEAIKEDNVANIIATPNISVLSGESASFQVTSQFTPIVTLATESGTQTSTGTPVDYGISMVVQPRVYSKDRIVLNISQEVSNIKDIVKVDSATAPNLKKRRTESVIELADGDSFIIGGLIDEKSVDRVVSVPFFGDIPLIGSIFRKVQKTKEKTELIVIATVTLTEPVKNKKDLQVPSVSSAGLASLLFNIKFENVTLPWQREKELMSFMSNVGFRK